MEKNERIPDERATDQRAALQAAGPQGLKSKKFCRKCGGLMTYDYERKLWVCENGCTE